MPGFPKIWTIIMADPWFKSLTCNERGLFLQLLIICKETLDNGHVVVSSFAELGARCNLHRTTCAKIVTKFDTTHSVAVSKTEHGTIDIYIPKYLEYQRMTTKDIVKMMRGRVEKPTQKRRQAEQSIPKQSIPKQSSTTSPKKKIDRLNEYIANNPDRVRAKARDILAIKTGYDEHVDKWVREAIKEMRDYVIDHEDDPEYPLKERGVGGSVRNWFRMAKDIQDNKKAGKQSPYDKNGKHFEDAPRRSGGQSEPISIADIMAKAPEKPK